MNNFQIGNVNFEIGLKIFDICKEENLPIEDFRLFTYIQARGIDYFDKDNNVEALKELIDSQMIKDNDKILRDKHGIETRFSGELRQKLRLHEDEKFRNKKMKLFKEKILPRI